MSQPLRISGPEDPARDPSAPMTEEEAGVVVRMWIGNVPFFPRDEESQALITAELVSMGATLDQGMWLARRYAQLYRKEWVFGEMRALFCSRFKPADGLEANSAVFLDGIPPERPAAMLRALPEPAPRMIEGHVPTMEELTALVKQAAKPMPPPQPRTAEEIAAELYKRRTAAEVEAGKDRLRDEIRSICPHDRLDEDGVCRKCGADRRGF